MNTLFEGLIYKNSNECDGEIRSECSCHQGFAACLLCVLNSPRCWNCDALIKTDLPATVQQTIDSYCCNVELFALSRIFHLIGVEFYWFKWKNYSFGSLFVPAFIRNRESGISRTYFFRTMVTHQKACSQKGTCVGFFNLITTSPQISLEPVAGDPDNSPGTFRPLIDLKYSELVLNRKWDIKIWFPLKPVPLAHCTAFQVIRTIRKK